MLGPHRPLGAAAPLLLALVLVAPDARAQGGYSTEKYPELGLSMPVARHYEAVPTQPGEELVVLKFWEKKDIAERYGRKSRPTMDVVFIDWFPDPKPETPEGEEAEPRTTTKPKETDLPITTFDRFIVQRLQGWEPQPAVESEKALKGFQGSERQLVSGMGNNSKQLGWAFTWRNDERTIAIVGFADKDDFEDQQKIWRRAAEKLRLIEQSNKEIEKLERMYARQRDVLDPEFRIKVRSELVEGWEAEDTDNYIVVFSTKDQPLVRRICKEIEQIRKSYLELFPPVEPIDAVSTVRICKDRDEYIKYGGSPRSAGYWNSQKEELVFYDASIKEKGRATSDENTFIVLYHEAFHQYIHYSSGELPPHSWFNEGHGDYFSGALIKGGKLRKIDINPWRVRTIKDAVEARKHVPWEKIIRYEQAHYYSNPGLCYAQGWAMIFFLRESREVQKRDDWSAILPTYFDELKKAYADELVKAGNPVEREPRWEAGKKARERAVEIAFSGIDVKELEEAWIGYVGDMKVPD